MTSERGDEERQAELSRFLDRLGVSVTDEGIAILDQALTHRSWRVEHGGEGDNERLEFMGDAVISLVTTEYLYETRPEEQEGDLSKLRARMVSRRVLGEVALELGIGDLIRLGAGEQSTGGRRRFSTLGSALEAVCAALYFALEWPVLTACLREHVIEPALERSERRTVVDYKSELQEWTQKHLQDVPGYRLTEATGPDHQRLFEVEVIVKGRPAGEGRGTRKKHAENEAARDVLEKIQAGKLAPEDFSATD